MSDDKRGFLRIISQPFITVTSFVRKIFNGPQPQNGVRIRPDKSTTFHQPQTGWNVSASNYVGNQQFQAHSSYYRPQASDSVNSSNHSPFYYQPQRSNYNSESNSHNFLYNQPSTSNRTTAIKCATTCVVAPRVYNPINTRRIPSCQQNQDYQLMKKISHGPLAENLIEPSAKERAEVISMIRKHMPGMNIKKIKSVQNNFLEAMYLLKKGEYKSRYIRVTEKRLIHVTGASNVNSIIRDNFDWRRTSRGKFGVGVSFSGDAQYANRYANINIGSERVFIIVDVLVSNEVAGRYKLKVPPAKYDTTIGNNKKVYVKFNDNEVLPKYVAFYSTDDLVHIQHFRQGNCASKQYAYRNTHKNSRSYDDSYDEDDNYYGEDW